MPEPQDDLDPLTLLKRAQLLHDATLARHGDLLDSHAEQLTLLLGLEQRQQQHEAEILALLARLADRQDDLAQHQRDHAAHMARLGALIAQHEEHMDALRQILGAVLEMLRHRNGHGGGTP